jgi:hypothetical protein
MTDELQTRLTARLRAAQTSGDHPDPETLTAFRERKLDARPRNAVMDHLSHCVACRDVLSFSSESFSNRHHRFTGYLAAAAAVIVFFAGAATSTRDGGVVHLSLPQLATRLQSFPNAVAPKISYAMAGVELPAGPNKWRIRNSALESSVDMGKTWRRAKLDRRFNAQEVRYDGSDVWVRSQSGELLLSRDGGLHWTFLNPGKGR